MKRAFMLVGPAAAGVAAFALTARVYAVEMAVARAWCGQADPRAVVFLGHCMACWQNGLLAAAAMAALVMAARSPPVRQRA